MIERAAAVPHARRGRGAGWVWRAGRRVWRRLWRRVWDREPRPIASGAEGSNATCKLAKLAQSAETPQERLGRHATPPTDTPPTNSPPTDESGSGNGVSRSQSSPPTDENSSGYGVSRSQRRGPGPLDGFKCTRNGYNREKGESGTVETGAFKSGAFDTGVVETGAFKSGASETGTLETGALESGKLETGSAYLPAAAADVLHLCNALLALALPVFLVLSPEATPTSPWGGVALMLTGCVIFMKVAQNTPPPPFRILQYFPPFLKYRGMNVDESG